MANADLDKAQHVIDEAAKKAQYMQEEAAKKDTMIAELQNELKALRDALARSKEDLAKANAENDRLLALFEESQRLLKDRDLALAEANKNDMRYTRTFR